MDKLFWTSQDVTKLFKISKQTLLYAEEKGDIPKAERINRGKIGVRQWTIEQIPEIGKHFGFLKKPKNQTTITIYAPKGGVLKTTFCFTLARILALNGMKTLIVGLDPIQASITNYTFPSEAIESIDELSSDFNGLYHYFIENVKIDKIIQKTNLSTLDIIPETPELGQLDLKIQNATRREYFFKEKLLPAISEYDVVLFDNNPGWSKLVENSLAASNIVITPMGCDIESFKAIDKCLSVLNTFQKEAKIDWKHRFNVPTLLERNKISQEIYNAYSINYKDHIILYPIRRSVKGQEARVVNQCVFEHEPTSELASDYYFAITEIWKKIIQ